MRRTGGLSWPSLGKASTAIRNLRTLTHAVHRDTVLHTVCDEHCSDDDLAKLQQSLIERPNAGELIRGSKGLRKLRWALPGRGKRGGARVIYYWRTVQGQILLLYAYAKSDQSELTDEQRKLLVHWVNEAFDHE
jgi:mRNA-degrading endonuclease RelE of RelBE toxin-antitoxin system